MTQQEIDKVRKDCTSVLLFHAEPIKSRLFYNNVLRLIYDRIDHKKEIKQLNERLEHRDAEIAILSRTRKGTWKDNGNGTVSCSECSTWFPAERKPYLLFCGYCGADMREEGDKDGC